jgi:hypothetical protein
VRRAARGILVVAALAVGVPAAAGDPGTRQIVSKHRMYRVAISPRPATAPVGRIHTWTITVRTAAGKPVERAMIVVDGDMPAHGHGLALVPHTKELGKGRYAVQGMKFQMGGLWYVEFTIQAAPGHDVARVTFQLPM